MLIWASAGMPGNAARSGSDGASNNSESPHLRHGWMTHAPRSPQVLVRGHDGELGPVRNHEPDLAALPDTPQVLRLIQDAAAEHLAVHPGDGHPHGLGRVAGDARPAVVDEHLQVIGVIRQEPAFEFRMFAPLASHRVSLLPPNGSVISSTAALCR